MVNEDKGHPQGLPLRMIRYNPVIHHRRSICLKGYDYLQAGLYFITICVQNQECLFGEILKGELFLNEAGQMVVNKGLALPERFKNIVLHEFIVMPNHFHAILEIETVGATLVVAPKYDTDSKETVEATLVVTPNAESQPLIRQAQESEQAQGIAPTEKMKTLGDMLGAFQSIVTVDYYIRGVKTKNWRPFNGKLWQRNYWEHIIRNEQSYQTISNYRVNNPLNWETDQLHHS